MFASDPFQRLTAGGTFNRTLHIFWQRYDLFLIITGIIFVPLSLLNVSYSRFLGTSMHTMLDTLNAMQVQQNINPETGAYENSTYDPYHYSSSNSSSSAVPEYDPLIDALLSNLNSFGSQFVLEYLALLLFGIAGEAAMAYAVAELYVGRDPNWLDCLKKGFSRWCDVFGSAALVGLGMGVLNAFVQIIVVLVAVTGSNALAFLAILVTIAWIVVVIYVMVSMMILAPVIIVEGTGPISSIRRCWELSWGNRCYIFCTIFCLSSLYYTVQIILTGILLSTGGQDAVFSSGGAFLVILPALIYLPLAVM